VRIGHACTTFPPINASRFSPHWALEGRVGYSQIKKNWEKPEARFMEEAIIKNLDFFAKVAGILF